MSSGINDDDMAAERSEFLARMRMRETAVSGSSNVQVVVDVRNAIFQAHNLMLELHANAGGHETRVCLDKLREASMWLSMAFRWLPHE